MCWWARGDSSTGGGTGGRDDGGQVLWKTGWMLAMVEAAVADDDRVRDRRVIVVRWWRIVGVGFLVRCSGSSNRSE